MAIQLNSGNHEAPLSEINVTPLVDVMLVLLVIFIIVAPMFSQAIRVDLPKTTAPTSTEPVVVDLSLNEKGQLYLDGELTNHDLLVEQLQDEAIEKPDLVVRIGADATTDYQAVAQLLSTVRAAGISRLAFSVQSP